MSARENGELTMADKNENGSAFDLLGQFDIAPIKAVKDTPFEFITNSAFFMILTVAVIAVRAIHSIIGGVNLWNCAGVLRRRYRGSHTIQADRSRPVRSTTDCQPPDQREQCP